MSFPPSDLDNIRILQIGRLHKKNGEEILGSGSRMEYFANTNDGRQVRTPSSFLKFAAQDERVEAGFVDNCHSSVTFKSTISVVLTILFSYVSVNISTTILVPEVVCYIFTHKPRFSINSQSTEISELRMKVWS